MSFGELYIKTSDLRYLRGTINAFEAFRISAQSISKTYNQENARLDIIENLHPKYQAYIRFLWKAYNNTNNKEYAERAFEISEESKATVLSLGINENIIKNSSDIPDDLLKAEQILHISLAALKKNIENTNEDKLIQKYLEVINETEIRLGKLNEKLENYPEYRSRKFQQNQLVKIKEVRKNLRKNEVLLSYVDLGKEAIVFALTKTKFEIATIKNKALFEQKVKDLKAQTQKVTKLGNTEFIFANLIKPFKNIIQPSFHIIFIGDGITNGLPMECLVGHNGEYLIESNPISYLFSAKFIQTTKKVSKSNSILAFAPFASDKNNPDFLPNSKKEVENLPDSKIFLDSDATKKVFLENAKDFPIIHLSTHAVADLKSPEKSFIQFHNNQTQKEDNKLYLFELSAGMLKNTQLVFLSACDSYGNINLDGEGIRGLSRGFYLTGSQSIISSLWQAEDYSTTYLTKKFYKHLVDGKTYPIALQMAKMDLIADPTMVQFRHPKFWAHLVYVGFQKQNNSCFLTDFRYLGVILFLFLTVLFIKKRYPSSPKS